MKEQLRIEDEISEYKTRQFASIEQQFEQFQMIVHECIHQEQIEQLIQFITAEIEPFLFSTLNNEVLDLMFTIEPIIKEKYQENVAIIYLIMGHCSYFYMNFEEARKFYKLATSYAMEYKQFAVLSSSLNKYNSSMIETGIDRVLWESSKYPSIFWVKNKGACNKYFLVRIIAHIELSLKLEKNEYAYQIYNKYFEQIQIELTPRFKIQLESLKGDILNSLNKYDEALILYHKLLKICINEVSYRDLIVGLYERISVISQKLNDAQLPLELQQSYEQYFEQLHIDKEYLQKHLAMATSNSNYVNSSFPMSYDQFINEVNEHLSNASLEGLSLVIIDIKIREDDRQLENEILFCINEKIQDAFGDRRLLNTRIDETTIGYLVRESELGTEVQSERAFHEVRKLYPKEESPLSAIYFAAVNNAENNLTTYEQCRKLAYAYIYYEFYK
ncbi:hypothetical protein LZ480_06735 [Solibacillus sp. MA9]|uniref:Tetratricopeptide repeat protein n=1 Tax=Solibacillus palustris TaxID=2908203 RepID=A0ABS9UB56_9BACL|nr:hypothetical protein [Solibacillus sp. MA9]MCH7321587.1 hypothetical protein [Solibacillus sp. MA9]